LTKNDCSKSVKILYLTAERLAASVILSCQTAYANKHSCKQDQRKLHLRNQVVDSFILFCTEVVCFSSTLSTLIQKHRMTA